MTVDDCRSRFAWLGFTEQATRKMIEMIPEDRWDFTPATGCRTVGELVTHLYGSERATFLAVLRGSMTNEEYTRDIGPVITSMPEALELAESAHSLRSEVLQQVTQADLDQRITLFYGEFSGEQVIGFVYDEHWHHRGQLSVYLRCMGLEPPQIYGE